LTKFLENTSLHGLGQKLFIFLTHLAFCGPTDLKSKAEEAVMAASPMCPCSMPRGRKQFSAREKEIS
jgi:hypothetical protein